MTTADSAVFHGHGIAAAVAESRGVIAAVDADGHALALALSMDLSERGWILLTDIDKGVTEQLYLPEGVPNWPSFASLLSRNGRLYTMAGPVLLKLDLSTRQVIHSEDLSAYGGPLRQSLARGPNDALYAAFTKSIVRIEPGGLRHEHVGTPPEPITAGAVISPERLYFASGSHLFSWELA